MGQLTIVFGVAALARILSCNEPPPSDPSERVTAEGEQTLFDGSKLSYRTTQEPPALRFRGVRSGAGQSCVFAIELTPSGCGGWQHDPTEDGGTSSWEEVEGASGKSFVACGRRFECPHVAKPASLDSADAARTLATSDDVDDAGVNWHLTTRIEPGDYVFGCSTEQADGTRSADIHISQSGCRGSTSLNSRGADADGRVNYECGATMMICGSWYPCACLPKQGELEQLLIKE